MKLLAVIVVTLTLVLMVEKVKPTVTDDEKTDNSILELEEELYQLTKQDAQSEDNHFKHQQTTHSSFAQDEFDQVLSDITKLAKEIRNEKKNKEDYRQH